MSLGAPLKALVFGLCALTLGFAPGCVDEPEPASYIESPVINGSRTTSRRWTVAVVNLGLSGSGGLCTGTLIGDYVVLTAKHCVYEDRGGRTWDPVPRPSLAVISGHDLFSAGGIEDMVAPWEVRSTPGNYTDADLESGNDVALILLPRKLTGNIPPRQYSTNLPRSGDDGLIVGFGVNNTRTEESGLKYEGNVTVFGANFNLVEAGGSSWTCQGDSGGPLIVNSRVVGVTSFGIGGCGSRSRHFFASVARHSAMIEDALTFEPPCEPMPEVCDGVDNDCNDLIDEGCTGLGDPCARDEECINGSCADVGGSQLCVRDCDPRRAIPMCPVGFHCEALGCGTGRCIEGAEGPKPDGDECANSQECASNRCTMIAGAMRCGRQCDPEAADCGGTNLCETTGDGCGTCLPAALSTQPRPFGAPCDEDGDCASGMCAPGEGAAEPFCTRRCGGTDICLGGFHCREGVCVNGDPGGPGDGCLVDDDCASGNCTDIDGDRICVTECGDGCIDGFSCVPTDVGDRCVPDGLGLGAMCSAGEECRTGICAGTCTRICDEAPCPSGFDCIPAGEVSGCFPASDSGDGGGGGGCSASGSAGAGWLALVLFVVGRRRRR